MQRTSASLRAQFGVGGALCANVLLWVTLLASASTASAHPLVEEGMQLAADLELEAAREVFDRALDSHELEREEIVRVLIERAFVLHALRDKDALVEAFAWLAAFDPDYVLGVRAPPDMVAVWTSVRDQARGRLSVRVEYEVAPGRLRAQSVLTGVQPMGLVTELGLREASEDWELRIDTGTPGAGSQASVEQAYPEGAEVELYARVEGLGAELATDGSAEAPIRVVVPPLRPPDAVALSAGKSASGEQRDDRRVRRRRAAWISAACAVVVAGAVAAAVLWPRDESPTTITPMVAF